VGTLVGEAVGRNVGALFGALVGAAEGTSVGALVGTSVGVFVGSCVGISVGASVGATVGTAVGAAVFMSLKYAIVIGPATIVKFPFSSTCTLTTSAGRECLCSWPRRWRVSLMYQPESPTFFNVLPRGVSLPMFVRMDGMGAGVGLRQTTAPPWARYTGIFIISSATWCSVFVCPSFIKSLAFAPNRHTRQLSASIEGWYLPTLDNIISDLCGVPAGKYIEAIVPTGLTLLAPIGCTFRVPTGAAGSAFHGTSSTVLPGGARGIAYCSTRSTPTESAGVADTSAGVTGASCLAIPTSTAHTCTICALVPTYAVPSCRTCATAAAAVATSQTIPTCLANIAGHCAHRFAP
jgi:hypothetical protein